MPPPGPAPEQSRAALLAWNLMGGCIDWGALPWVADYLGIDDLDAVILDMTVIRDWQR
ncbi:MAG TPA: hypothetical protein PLU25_17015 [Acidobacteriota bacterium]|mgnify:CR=1 FL=1|nr:hypothetical protein [Acidobacteriota bacterium]